ncbi:MAG: hypothetical protein KJS92_09875, partial [Bacteroidetes bacterium]|nr:hypothetical protein [Bacteroidota bacterium]
MSAQLLLPLKTNLPGAPLIRQIDGNIYAVWPERYTDSMDVYSLSRYDGRTWTNMPPLRVQRGGVVSDLAVYNGKVYAAGNFRLLNDPQFNCITVLENKVWAGVASFTASFAQVPHVLSLAVFNNSLYAGGRFLRVNGALANNLVFYQGSSWEPLGSGVPGADGPILQLASRGPDLGICGGFRKINGATAPGLAFYNGAQFISKYTPVKSGRRLYAVAGSYWYSGLDSNGRMVLASMIGFNSLKLSMNGLDSIAGIDGFCEWSGSVYAVGRFYKTGSKTLINIVMQENQNWVAHPILTPNQFVQIAALGTDVYFSGSLNKIQGKSLGNGVVKLVPGRVQVSGVVFHDVNSNGTRDMGERPLPNRKINISGLGDLFTDASGYYEFKTPIGGNVTISLEPQLGWKSAMPVNLNLTDSPWQYQVNFAQLPVEQNFRDMRVNIISGEGWMVNRDATSSYHIKVENSGQVSSGGRLELQYNKKLSNVQVVPAPDLINTGKFTWNLPTMEPGQSYVVNMVSWVSSQDFEIGEQLGFHVVVIPNGSVPDENPSDNIDTLPQIVADRALVSVEKSQFPVAKNGDSMATLPNNDNVIQYVIRFENFGIDTVYQVQVIDTIDISLNMAYIRESGSSHPFTRQMILDPALPGKAIFIYTFSNINLPPNSSANPEWTQSKGFFGLNVGLKAGNRPGTVIKNRAGVMFDLEASVLSNTVTCMLTGNNGRQNDENPASALMLYPNPTSGTTLVQHQRKITDLKVLDFYGRALSVPIHLSGSGAVIHTGQLAAGRYL